jgi:simple sugar transport system ATP-binding protein
LTLGGNGSGAAAPGDGPGHDASGIPGSAAADGVALAGVGLYKHFGHVEALQGATLSVRKGEVTVLFGDNGAGKSTFMRVLCGIYAPDGGQVFIDGNPVELESIRDAHSRGIDVIHQDLALAPDLTVLENIFLGHEKLVGGWRKWFGVLGRAQMAVVTDQALHELGIDLPSVRVEVRALSGGQRQAVAVARAVMWSRTAILMDEPTAALGTRQSDVVVETIRRVAERGLGVFVISHDIPRMLRVADTAAVLRRGAIVLEAPARDVTINDVVHAMVGDADSD